MAVDDQFGLEAEHARLSEALLRLPRHPRRFERDEFQRTLAAIPDAENWARRSPVAGVVIDHGERRLIVLIAHDVDLNVERLRDSLAIESQVAALHTGPIIPAQRPAQGGDSISGEVNGGSTGTICCLVEDATGERFLLGCNHTLAGVNQAKVSQDIALQPGALDGGRAPTDSIGTLATVASITLGGYVRNTLDAALVEVSSGDADAGIRHIGPIAGATTNLPHGTSVEKVGWRTGHTTGECLLTGDFTVNFARGPALFVNHYGVFGYGFEFAREGDSGAPVFVDDELVGMVVSVASQNNLTFVTPIDVILNYFKVEPVL